MAVTKTFFTGLSIATVLLFGGGVFLYMNLSHYAKPMIERIAGETLGVPVTIDSLDISIPERRVQVGGLKIANPEGYNGRYALTTDSIDVQLESIAQNLLTFKTIAIEKSEVNLEVTPQGSNLNDIKNGISAKRAAAAPQEDAASTGSENEQKAESMKVVIKKFEFNDASLNPSLTLVKEEKLEPIVAPDLTLTGIGERQNGVLAREAIAQIANAVFKNLNSAAGQSGFLSGLSKDQLKEMGQGQIDALKEKLPVDVDNIKDKVKGLFGN